MRVVTAFPTSGYLSLNRTEITQNSSSGVNVNGDFPVVPSADESVNAALFDPSNLPRRQLFRQTAYKIQEMLVSLEEKNA